MNRRRTVLLAGILAALLANTAIAADLELAPRRKPQPQSPPAAASPAPPSPLTAPEAACLEWTDGCRTCQRPAGGEAGCSNVGIACVQQAVRCTRR